MKKCSQSSHHTLTELNITPLLDLAFVLLVIFIITTTPIANDLELNLPKAAKRDKPPKPKLHYVSVSGDGRVFLEKTEITDVAQLQAQVTALRIDDPDLNVVIRGDAKTKYQRIVEVMDMLQQANVLRIELATEALTPGPDKKK